MKQKVSDRFLIFKTLYRKRASFVGVGIKELPAGDLVLQTLISNDRTQPEPPLQNTLSCRRS